MAWNGRVWRRDRRVAVQRMLEVTRQMMREAAMRLADVRDKREQDEAEADLKHARASQSKKAVMDALELAQSLPPIATSADVFDQLPMFLCVLNGVVNLQTGELGEHVREDLLTQMVELEFDPEAKAPVWERVVADALPDEAERAFLQRYAGYSASGDTSEQCFTVLFGDGANSKSTILEGIKSALGEYAAEASNDTFMTTSRGRGPDNKLAALRAVRLVSSSESGEGRKLDETLVQRIGSPFIV